MAITTMDQLVAALVGSRQDLNYSFQAGTNGINQSANLNRLGTGNCWGVPTTPTSTPVIPTDATPGYPSLTDPASGQSLYLARWNVQSSQSGWNMIFDRVFHVGGFSGILTTAQSISALSLPSARCPSNGEGLEIWLESYTATGASAANVTASYTNSSGTSGRTTVATAMITSFPVARMLRLPLQEGDTGVQSVQSLTLSASTGTAGNFGLTLLKRKATLNFIVGPSGAAVDFVPLGLRAIESNSCLQFVQISPTSGTGLPLGYLSIIAG
jgi:hypothetical protein